MKTLTVLTRTDLTPVHVERDLLEMDPTAQVVFFLCHTPFKTFRKCPKNGTQSLKAMFKIYFNGVFRYRRMFNQFAL